MDGSADGAEIQFSLQPQLSALDVGLMERLLWNVFTTNNRLSSSLKPLVLTFPVNMCGRRHHPPLALEQMTGKMTHAISNRLREETDDYRSAMSSLRAGSGDSAESRRG